MEAEYSNEDFFDGRVPVDAIEDGPIWPVEHDFRRFFMDSLHPLGFTKHNPQAAAKIILALCIRAAGKRSPHFSEMHRDFDIVDECSYFPQSYDKGPFLNLLRISHEDGIRVILRIAEVATNKWLTDERQKNCQMGNKETNKDAHALADHFTLGLAFNGQLKTWIGNGQWMHSCRASGSAVTC
jgi:hypothetical protein